MTTLAGSSDTTKSVSERTEMSNEFLTSGIIKIYVGPKRKEYQIHKGLLFAKSSWFASALRLGAFKEGVDNEIFLGDDDPKVFDIFSQWLYYGTLAPFDMNDKAALETCLKLYVFADKICQTELMRMVADGVRKWARVDTTPVDCIAYVYENAAAMSGLRKELVSSIAEDIIEKGLLLNGGPREDELVEEVKRNGDFAADLVRAILRANIPPEEQLDTLGHHVKYFQWQDVRFAQDGMVKIRAGGQFVDYYLGRAMSATALYPIPIRKIESIDHGTHPNGKARIRTTGGLFSSERKSVHLEFEDHQRMLAFVRDLRSFGALVFHRSNAYMDSCFESANAEHLAATGS